jgi:hypothetical protein
MKRALILSLTVVAMTVMAGCGDPVDRMLASGEPRNRLIDRIASRPDVATDVVNRLLAADSTRTLLLDRVMEGGEARQAILTRVAKDRTLMDGAINFAVQDSSMRDHLMTLVKGIEMGAVRDRRVPFPQGLQVHQ